MTTFFLFLSLFANPDIMLAEAKAAVNRADYDDALPLLTTINRRRIQNKVEHQYLLAVSAYGLNNKVVAQPACEYILSDFNEVPVRYIVIAERMLEEMKEWKNEKDLGDIGRRMSDISRRLASAKGGKETRQRQKNVLDDLDRLIKKAEDDAAAAANKSEQGKGNGDKSEKGEAQPGDSQGRPKDDSDIAGGIGKGEVDQKKVRELASVWGKLPEKEQTRRMLEITRDLPARYRDSIEAYLKGISAKSNVRK